VAAVNAWGKLGVWTHYVCFTTMEARAAIERKAAGADDDS
jgi:hypothetical protein